MPAHEGGSQDAFNADGKIDALVESIDNKSYVADEWAALLPESNLLEARRLLASAVLNTYKFDNKSFINQVAPDLINKIHNMDGEVRSDATKPKDVTESLAKAIMALGHITPDYPGDNKLYAKLVTVMFRPMLEQGADPALVCTLGISEEQFSGPLLMYAARTGNTALVQLLLSNLTGRYGQGIEMPVKHHDLAVNSHDFSLHAGLVDPRARYASNDENTGRHSSPLTCALMVAFQEGHVHLIEMLMKAGAKLDQKSAVFSYGIYGENLALRDNACTVLTNALSMSKDYPAAEMIGAVEVFDSEIRQKALQDLRAKYLDGSRQLQTLCLVQAVKVISSDMAVVAILNEQATNQWSGRFRAAEFYMYVYALKGNYEKCMRVFAHENMTTDASIAAPNIIAGLMSAEVDNQQVKTLLNDRRFIPYLKGSIQIVSEYNGLNLAKMAAMMGNDELLEAFLNAGIPHTVPEGLRPGDQANAADDNPAVEYKDKVKQVLARHVLKRYLNAKGVPLEAKDSRTFVMWLKTAWMHIKRVVLRHSMTYDKVKAFKAIADNQLTPETLKAANAAVLDKHHRPESSGIFSKLSHEVVESADLRADWQESVTPN